MFDYRPDIVKTTYEYYLFFKEADIAESTIELEQLFFAQIFKLWLPIFIVWSCVYILVCYLVIHFISHRMLQPINKLTKRIHKSVISLRQLRQAQDRHDFGIEMQDKMYRGMQIDLLKGYSKQNRETNLLYFDFNQKAKILFMANAVSH